MILRFLENKIMQKVNQIVFSLEEKNQKLEEEIQHLEKRIQRLEADATNSRSCFYGEFTETDNGEETECNPLGLYVIGDNIKFHAHYLYFNGVLYLDFISSCPNLISTTTTVVKIASTTKNIKPYDGEYEGDMYISSCAEDLDKDLKFVESNCVNNIVQIYLYSGNLIGGFAIPIRLADKE